MKRLASSLSALAIFVWILPLGAFIKPSQEKTACGGNRAFHMCSMGMGKLSADSSSKASFKNVTAAERHAKSSAAGENDFIITHEGEFLAPAFQRRHLSSPFFVHLYFLDLTDPPPKTLSLIHP